MAGRHHHATKPCNHKTSGNMGAVIYWDNKIGPPIFWCMNCGAIECGTGWRYPKRAYEMVTPPKPKRHR